MSKSLLAVFGATGNQGNSTAHAVLNDPELSQRYNVRAISRDISSPKMQELKSKGAELVQADLDDPSTLPAALQGADYVFFMTATQYAGHTRDIETRQAKAFCAEALQQGVQYIIFSSMCQPTKLTHGALSNVEHFDVKAEIEAHIRSLPVKSSFFAPGCFMQNFSSHLMPRPSPSGDGSFVITNIGRGATALPLIDIEDTGKWIAAILADPDKYEGKFFAAAEGTYTLDESCRVIEKVTGKTVRLQQVPDELFKGFLPEGLREPLYEMWLFQRDYGYYGADTEGQVRWAKEQARGKLASLEEFLRRTEYKLE